jgi:hypothetical protein
MDTIKEKEDLNPCHILIQAIPKRRLSSKEEGLGRILDQLIFRYKGIFFITSKTIKLERELELELEELESCPLTPTVKGFDFLIFLLKPVLSCVLFRDPAQPRLATPKKHG